MISPPANVARSAREAIERATVQKRLKKLPEGVVHRLHIPLAYQLSAQARDHAGPHIVAVSGLPGTGKSTLAASLSVLLEDCFGLGTASFSTDDLYLSQEERSHLAEEIHPLFAVRGPPGTHRIDLGQKVIEVLRGATDETVTRLPRFDKGADNPLAQDLWPLFLGRPDVILVDSWFWQIGPVPEDSLEAPLNQRERDEDPDGIWREAVNRFLSEGYPDLFAQADYWIHLAVPSWEATVRWRVEQEMDRRAQLPIDQRPTDDPTEHLRSFLDLFERWGTMPHLREPDLEVKLNDDHSAGEISSPASQSPENQRTF